MNDVTATVSVDVSEAIQSLKALQRQAKETVHALKDVEELTSTVAQNIDDESAYYLNLCKVLGVIGDNPADRRYINKQLYDLIIDSTLRDSVIHYKRGDGATTSAEAALLTFDRTRYVTTCSNLFVHDFARKHSISHKVVNIMSPMIYPSLVGNVYILDNRLDIDSVRHILFDADRTITLYGHED